jgi:hypothetical protein
LEGGGGVGGENCVAGGGVWEIVNQNPYTIFFSKRFRQRRWFRIIRFVRNLSRTISMTEPILETHPQILANEQDREVFFNALLDSPKPNATLQHAMAEYLEALDKV